MDRGLFKLTALPFFDSSFRNVLELLLLCTVEQVINVPATTGSQLAALMMEWAPTILAKIPAKDLQAALTSIAACFDQLELFWTLVMESKGLLLLQEARMAGFGCFVARDLDRPKQMRSHPMASSSKLLSTPILSLPGPLKQKDALEPDQLSTQLLKSELLAKDKWIRRLEAIAQAAGPWAKVNANGSDRSILSAEEADLLRKISLAKGAFRTLAVHVRHFERLQQFAVDKGLQLYPLSVDLILKYGLWLYNRNCGPTVIPSVRAAVSWVGRRLRIDLPQLADAQILALEDRCIQERAKELKEAVPIPLVLVGLLELFVMTQALRYPVACLYVGWILCMIYASLRFNDAVHVHTDSLHFVGEVLYGLCWQTKVERKRRGTKFAIASIGVVDVAQLKQDDPSVEPWLSTFWQLSQMLAPGSRDFWMYELDDLHTMGSTPVTYQRSLKFFKALIAFGIDNAPNSQLLPNIDELKAIVPTLTWHSCKVTMVDAAVHANEDSVAISIQAHHSSPALVEKKYQE